MHIKRLSLLNFKNIVELHTEFSPTINALVGSNGAGKTNVIDALHFLALSKSMLGLTDRQSVRHGAPFFMVDGTFVGDEGNNESVVCALNMQGNKSSKSLKCNGKEYERLSDHVGKIPVVVVAPQDSTLIYDGAEERRRFINSFISQLDVQYLTSLIRYNATLAQRNSLLKSHQNLSMLDIYDMQLAESAAVIHSTRARIIAQMQPLVEEYYRALSNDREPISLDYSSSLNEQSLTELLATARAKDIANEYTTVGVHRDELVFKIGGLPLRKYGSQGQQKSFLIALKLAQHQIVSSARSERPILLLDDLFDKLDASRVEALLKIVSSSDFGQIFITDCNRAHLEKTLTAAGSKYALYEVIDGDVTKWDFNNSPKCESGDEEN